MPNFDVIDAVYFLESLHPINSQVLTSSADLEIKDNLSISYYHLMFMNLATGVLFHGGGNFPACLLLSGPSTCNSSTDENKDRASIPSDSPF